MESGSALRGFTMTALIGFILVTGMFGLWITNELQSRESISFSTHFWLFMPLTGSFWLLTLVFYIAYYYTVIKTEMGLTQLLYPRFTWEINWFFTSTALLYVLAVITWASVLSNTGLSFIPNYDNSIENTELFKNSFKVYVVHFYAMIFSLMSFFIGLNFLYIFSTKKPFVLSNHKNAESNDYIKPYMRGQRPSTTFSGFWGWPGSSHMQRSKYT